MNGSGVIAPGTPPDRASLALARLLAWLVDWLCILVYVAALAVLGTVLYTTGLFRGRSLLVDNLVALVLLVVPVTLALARLESGARRATIGKRVRGLQVLSSSTGQPVSWARALLRNLFKIALPWTLGHIVVYGLARSDPGSVLPVWLSIMTAVAYALPLTYVLSLFVRRGRTPYDWIAGTQVSRTRTGQTPA